MKLLKVLVLCIVLTFFFSIGAKANYTSEQFQQSYFEIGYTGIHKALKESSKHFNRNIELPVQLPPIAFTHTFARGDNIEEKPNTKLEIEYINKDMPQNHYMIFVQPTNFGLKIKENFIDQRIKENDGVKAIYSTKIVRGFNLFVFEKNGFQYVLSVDKRISNKVTPEVLLEIAHSIPE
ncbi:hypothetical protein E2K98_13010 [Bacillus salipaludis]|uniref:DUF4367 domain-containing protein n=1 Tax=Bacillus salipaludis TaxID=2547811 RepID=A0A4R5VSR0_9BACI|nr:hypothetical protein E2K98_13010 [Bacillus salipaludis]